MECVQSGRANTIVAGRPCISDRSLFYKIRISWRLSPWITADFLSDLILDWAVCLCSKEANTVLGALSSTLPRVSDSNMLRHHVRQSIIGFKSDVNSVTRVSCVCGISSVTSFQDRLGTRTRIDRSATQQNNGAVRVVAGSSMLTFIIVSKLPCTLKHEWYQCTCSDRLDASLNGYRTLMHDGNPYGPGSSCIQHFHVERHRPMQMCTTEPIRSKYLKTRSQRSNELAAVSCFPPTSHRHHSR